MAVTTIMLLYSYFSWQEAVLTILAAWKCDRASTTQASNQATKKPGFSDNCCHNIEV